MSGKSRYDKKGKFLYRKSKKAVFNVQSEETDVTIISPETEELKIGKYTIAPWFDPVNNHPVTIRDTYIKKSTVLQASITYKQSLIMGQGIFAAKIIGYEKSGAEILAPVTDPEIITFCNSRMVNSYISQSALNMASYKNLFPELIMNEPKSKLLGLYEKSSLVSRWGVMNKDSKIENAYFTSNWAEPKEENIKEIPVLDYDMPLEDLKDRAKNNERFIFLNSMYSSEYYLTPDYETAINAKWVDLSFKTPIYLNAAYDNALNILFHIKIPDEYFEMKFPISEYETHNDRMDAIDTFFDELEKELTTVEKAKKTITNISVPGADGKPLYWEIDIIDPKQSISKDVLASDAADSQITNTFLINDAVFLKKGGSGQGAGSGSDIREAHLINVSLVKDARDRIIEPLGLIRDFNGAPWTTDMVFRFRDTVLSTLNSGSGTEAIVS